MIRWLLVLAFTLACLPTAFAQSVGAQPVRTEHTEASIISERSSVVPGDRFMAALKLDLDEGGWHVYWKNPGDSGLPPEIDWTLPEGAATGEFMWPAPHAIPLATLMNYGYEHELVLPFEITIPATAQPGDIIQLKGDASWLICLETCIPESADLVFSVPVSAVLAPDEAGSAAIASALEQVPAASNGEAFSARDGARIKLGVSDVRISGAAADAVSLRFFPDTQDIAHAAPQDIRFGDAGVSFDLAISDYAEAGDLPLAGVIVADLKDGERLAWSVESKPGVIPAGVSDRAFGASGSGSGSGGGGFAALLPVLIGAFLGGLILNLMPCVLPVLSIKAASMVKVAHNPAETRAHGLAYTAGVLICFALVGAALIALKAAGVAAGLGFQLQYPPVVAFFTLLMFAVGLNLLGVFEIGGSLMGVGNELTQKQGVSGAFFTGLLAGFVGAPCVGPFMAPAVGVALSQPPPVVIGVFLLIGLGMAAPLLALSFSPALARMLPKPGAWMATFRQVLAFPMFLTAVWLLWVLAGQGGSDAVILTVAAAAVLSFGVWLANAIGSRTGGRVAAGLFILAGLLGPSLAFGLRPAAAPELVTASAADSVYEPWSLDRIAQAQAEGRPVFVDFTARWCVTCQVNERGTLVSSEVKAVFAETRAVLLKADWTNRDEIIAAELAKHGRAGVPLYLVYPAGGGEPEILPQLLTAGTVVTSMRKAAGAAAADLGPASPDARQPT